MPQQLSELYQKLYWHITELAVMTILTVWVRRYENILDKLLGDVTKKKLRTPVVNDDVISITSAYPTSRRNHLFTSTAVISLSFAKECINSSTTHK